MPYSYFDEIALSSYLYYALEEANDDANIFDMGSALECIDNCIYTETAFEASLSKNVSNATKELNANLMSLKKEIETAYNEKNKSKLLQAVKKCEMYLNNYEKHIDNLPDDSKGFKMLKFAGKALILAASIAFIIKQKKLFSILSSNVSKAVLNVSDGKAIKAAKIAGKASEITADFTVGGLGIKGIISSITGAFKYRMAKRDHPDDPKYQNQDYRVAKNMIENYRQVLQGVKQSIQNM